MSMQTACGILNELARMNKITPIYNTSAQDGPPHQKTFRVQLHLQEYGTYEGSGLSIKEAKNKAALAGIQSCTLSSMGALKTSMQMSPTVELNILSMRSGEAVEYTELDPGHIRNPNPIQNYDKLIVSGNKVSGSLPIYRQFIKIFRVAVSVLGQSFVGEGKVKQDARNDAARKALMATRDQLFLKVSQSDEANGQDENDQGFDVAKLYELALRNSLKPTYNVITVAGPSHLMRFSVKCSVGKHETTGEGIGKRLAKRIAAKKMLELLSNAEDFKSLPDESKRNKKHYPKYHKKSKKKKNHKPERTIDIFLDPVTYLTQLMQSRKEPAPSYSLLQEIGNKNERKFEMQVSIGNSEELVATGIGSTKKEAKRNAADALLKICGIDQEKIRESENEVKKA